MSDAGVSLHEMSMLGDLRTKGLEDVPRLFKGATFILSDHDNGEGFKEALKIPLEDASAEKDEYEAAKEAHQVAVGETKDANQALVAADYAVKDSSEDVERKAAELKKAKESNS